MYRTMILAASLLGAGLGVQPAMAAPPVIVPADRADVACIITVGKVYAKVLADKSADPQRQAKVSSLEQMVAFYIGKIVGRHPGSKAEEISKGMKFVPADQSRLFQPPRCYAEFSAAVIRK